MPLSHRCRNLAAQTPVGRSTTGQTTSAEKAAIATPACALLVRRSECKKGVAKHAACAQMARCRTKHATPTHAKTAHLARQGQEVPAKSVPTARGPRPNRQRAAQAQRPKRSVWPVRQAKLRLTLAVGSVKNARTDTRPSYLVRQRYFLSVFK